MRARRGRWIGVGAIALSLAAHLLAVRMAPRWSAPAPAPGRADTVELVVVDERPAHPTPAEDLTPATEAREPQQPSPAPPKAAPAVATRSATVRPPEPAPAQMEQDERDDAVSVQMPPERPAICDVLVEPETHPGCVPAPERPSLDTWRVITPGQAARAAVASVDRDVRSSATPPDAGVRIGRALAEDLARVANRTPHVSERPPPHLQRRSDGSYRYEGVPFDAVIAADGTVTFEDRHADMPVPGSFTFDVTDEAMRAAGQDPYQYERQWFIAETRELRDRLADEARERDRRRAMHRLESRLASIWSDTGRSAAARRHAIFTLWDDCADDDVGQQARRIVVRFVRRHLPEGSPDAYGQEELRRLNAARVSPEPFAPYG